MRKYGFKFKIINDLKDYTEMKLIENLKKCGQSDEEAVAKVRAIYEQLQQEMYGEALDKDIVRED